MTTMPFTHRQSNPMPILFSLMAALIILMAAIVAVLPQAHATNKHDEAGIVRKCLNENGPYQVWRRSDGTYYFPCRLADGKFGLQVAVKDGTEWIEKTAFIKDGGTWAEFVKYMVRLGATRFTGPLP